MNTLREDILGEFGFRVVYTPKESAIEFKAYEIITYDNYESKNKIPNFRAISDEFEYIENEAQAEVYIEGYVKWDGCAEFDLGSPHFCSRNDVTKHGALVLHVYDHCMTLLQQRK